VRKFLFERLSVYFNPHFFYFIADFLHFNKFKKIDGPVFGYLAALNNYLKISKIKMKKTIVAIALILGAMSTKAQQLELMSNGGINISNQSSKGGNGKSKVGFQTGFGLNIYTKLPGFSVQPEINYISKGASYTVLGKKSNYNLNYLELPVLAKYSIGPVFLNAGPSVGLLLGSSKKAESVMGDLKKIDLGLQLGGGFAVPMSEKGKLILDLRYGLGLSKISKDQEADLKNRGFLISLGYALRLK
jgi:hypothetical protein